MAIQYLPATAAERPPAPPPASPPTAPVTAPPPPSPSLVLLGRNRNGKPRAAWFADDQAEAAKAAAEAMKLQALPITDDAQRALATQLARGRILASGKAHVPGARRDWPAP